MNDKVKFLKKNIDNFLWTVIYPHSFLRKFLYLINNRRDKYIKIYNEFYENGDRWLMLKYLLKYGISYEEFYFFDVKHNDPSSFISECERFKYYKRLNNSKFRNLLTDKSNTYQKLSDLYKRDFKKVECYDDFISFVEKNPIFVFKNIDGCGGRGVCKIDTSKKDKDIIWKELKDSVPFVAEELIAQGDEMAILHPESVNTIRIMVLLYKDENGDFIPKQFIPFLKVGSGNAFVDNGFSGGIFSCIDEDGLVYTDGVNEKWRIFKEHPDTKIKFKGFKIPEYQKAVNVAYEASMRIQELRFIGWDLAYTKNNGWVIVEGNSVPGLINQRFIDRKEKLRLLRDCF